jgi:hypothetical protein
VINRKLVRESLPAPGGECADVVVSPKNSRGVNNLNRQAVEEPLEVSAGIDTHMRGESIAKPTGEIIDQRDITKAIQAA